MERIGTYVRKMGLSTSQSKEGGANMEFLKNIEKLQGGIERMIKEIE